MTPLARSTHPGWVVGKEALATRNYYTESIIQHTSRLLKKRECRGAKRLWGLQGDTPCKESSPKGIPRTPSGSTPVVGRYRFQDCRN